MWPSTILLKKMPNRGLEKITKSILSQNCITEALYLSLVRKIWWSEPNFIQRKLQNMVSTQNYLNFAKHKVYFPCWHPFVISTCFVCAGVHPWHSSPLIYSTKKFTKLRFSNTSTFDTVIAIIQYLEVW